MKFMDFLMSLLARRLLRPATLLVIATSVLVFGCGTDSNGTVEVVRSASPMPTDPDVPPTAGPDLANLPTAQPQFAIRPPSTPGVPAGSEGPSSELSSSKSAVPQITQTSVSVLALPGSSAPEGEQTTGGTDQGGDEGGPGAEGPGGLVLYPDEDLGPFAQVTEKVYDLCDELDALAAVTGRLLGPGDEITDVDRIQIQMVLSADEVDCTTPGGNRYVYVDELGRTPARPTAAEAKALHDATQVGYEDIIKVNPPGLLLGYYGAFKREFPLIEQDEIVVLQDSVTIRDGVVRGLVHNLSETQYAREVTVTARNPQTSNGDSGLVGTWRWPLTLQPGERAPFEISDWTGTADPSAVSIQVTATTSTQPDYKRAFGIGYMEFNPADDLQYRLVVPSYARGDEPIPDRIFDFVEVHGLLMLPDSHPEAAEEMHSIVIEDPRVFFALLDNDKKVVDVAERVPYASFDTGDMRIDQLPAWYDDPLDGDRIPVVFMNASIITNSSHWQVWMGGANPSSTPQQTGQTTT